MAIARTHTVEDRIKDLEHQQDRMHQRMQSLAKLLSAPRRPVEPPPVGGGSTSPAGEAEPDVGEPPAASDAAAVAAGDTAAPAAGESAAAAAADLAQPPLEFWVPPPIEGGQPLFNDRVAIKSRVENLTTAVRSLSDTVQRLEGMVNLLGQVVYLAVDPETQPSGRLAGGPGSSLGISPGATGNGGGASLGGLAGLLSGLLGGNLGIVGTGGEHIAGSDHGKAHEAAFNSPEPESDDSEQADGTDGQGALLSGGAPALPPELQQVTALLPLLEQVLGGRGRTGTSRTSKLSSVINSSAFHQLVGMLQQNRSTGRLH